MIVTLDTLVVSPEVYDVVVNFCNDVGLNNIPDRDEMFFMLKCEDGVGENNTEQGSTTYLMDDIKLEKVPSFSGDGMVLVASGYSPAIENLYKEFNDGEDPEAIDIVVCSDFNPDTHDVDYLNAKLQDYFPVMKFSEIRTRYETQDDVSEYIMDGKSVDL